MSEIQDHLGVTIPTVGHSFEVPVNEYDGKVVYGERRKGEGFVYESHTSLLAPSVAELAKLELAAQNTFISSLKGKW